MKYILLALIAVLLTGCKKEPVFEAAITREDVVWDFRSKQLDGYGIVRRHTFNKDKTYEWYVGSGDGVLQRPATIPPVMHPDSKGKIHWYYNQNDSVFWMGDSALTYKMTRLTTDTIFFTRKDITYVMIAHKKPDGIGK